jgi:hypothetical protein
VLRARARDDAHELFLSSAHRGMNLQRSAEHDDMDRVPRWRVRRWGRQRDKLLLPAIRFRPMPVAVMPYEHC